jgi:hypothetical protein
MHDGVRLMFSQQLTDEIAVYDVTPNELMPRVASYAIEIVQVSRVGQFVEINNGSFSVLHALQDEVRPDESRAAGDENSISHSKCRLPVSDPNSCRGCKTEH